MILNTYTGGIGSGKTDMAFKDAERYKRMNAGPVVVISFADPLKEVLRNSLSLDKYSPHGVLKENPYEDHGEPLRSCLQNLLTSYDLPLTLSSVTPASFEVVRKLSVLCHNPKTLPREYSKAYRKIIQTVGSWVKESDNLYYTNVLIASLEVLRGLGGVRVLIDDLRYVDEYMALKEYANHQNIEYKPKFLDVSREVRAINLEISLEELESIERHDSESGDLLDLLKKESLNSKNKGG